MPSGWRRQIRKAEFAHFISGRATFHASSGQVIEINADVMGQPALLNTDPYGGGWLILLQPENAARDLATLIHGAQLQPWLEKSVAEWRAKGLLEK